MKSIYSLLIILVILFILVAANILSGGKFIWHDDEEPPQLRVADCQNIGIWNPKLNVYFGFPFDCTPI